MKIIESIRNYIGSLDCMATYNNAINANFLDGEVDSFSIEEVPANPIIKKYTDDIKENSIMAKMGASMQMKMDIMKDNSDAKIADMLIRGFTMGNIEIDKKIDKYKNSADKSILKIAKDLKKFGELNIELLKEYL